MLQDLEAPASTQPPSGLLAFAAGGSIYTIRADGSGLKQVVAGDRDGTDKPQGRVNWSSAPSFSPDGRLIAFVKDFDVWIVAADGGGERKLAEVADYVPTAGVSNFSLGTSNLAWSADGSKVFYVTNRIGGSGLAGAGLIDVATGDVHAYDQKTPLYTTGFLFGVWETYGGVDGGYPALWDGSTLHPIDPRDGKPVPEQARLPRSTRPGTLWRLDDDLYLAGSWVNGKPISLLSQSASKELATGVSPALSPTGDWIAYFADESLRLVRLNGRDDHEVLDLAPLGGRDRHFASQPDCFPGNAPACSYRPPLISWTSAP